MSKKDTGGKDYEGDHEISKYFLNPHPDSESDSLKAIDISDFDNASPSESHSLIHSSDFSDTSFFKKQTRRAKRSNRSAKLRLFKSDIEDGKESSDEELNDPKKVNRLAHLNSKKAPRPKYRKKISEDDININRWRRRFVAASEDNKKFEKQPKTKLYNAVALKSSQGPSIQKGYLLILRLAFADLKKVVKKMDRMVNHELTSLKQEELEFLSEEDSRNFYKELRDSEEDLKNEKIFYSEIIYLNKSLRNSHPNFIKLLKIIREQTKKIKENGARIEALELEANPGIAISEIKKNKVFDLSELVELGSKNKDDVNASSKKTSSVQNGYLSIAFPKFGDLEKLVEERYQIVNHELSYFKNEKKSPVDYISLDSLKDDISLPLLEEQFKAMEAMLENFTTDKAENPENGEIFLSEIKFLTQSFENIQSDFIELLEIMHEQTKKIKDDDTLIANLVADLEKKINDARIAELKKELNIAEANSIAAANNASQQYSIIQNATIEYSERISKLESEPSLNLKFEKHFSDLNAEQTGALIKKFLDLDFDVNYIKEKERITTEHSIELKSPHIQSVIDGLTSSQVELSSLYYYKFELLKSDVANLQSLEKKLSDRELAKKITDLTLEWQVVKANEILDQINSDISVRTKAIIEKSKELQTQLDENPKLDLDDGIKKIIEEFLQLSSEGKTAATDFAQAQLQLLPDNQFAQTPEDATIQAHRESYQREAARLIKIHQEKETEINVSKFQLSAEQSLLGVNETKSSFEASEKKRFELSLTVENRRFENELTDLKLRYLSQIVVTKITENLQAIEELASQVKSSKIDVEERLIENEINALEAIKPEETTLTTVVDYISDLKISETSKTRLKEIYANKISTRISAMSHIEPEIEPEGEVIRGFQEKLQSERQGNADFVNHLRQNIAAELKPFLTQDSLAQFDSFEASLNQKTDLLYQARYNQAKNAAIAKTLSGDIIAQIEDDISLLESSLVGNAPENCNTAIQDFIVATGVAETSKLDKKDTALEKAKGVYSEFESLSPDERTRLTKRFGEIIAATDGLISEEKKTEIRLSADEKLELSKSANADLIQDFINGLSESQRLLKTKEHQKQLDDAKLLLDELATKLYTVEVDTKINNLEAEALATNVKTKIENDLAAIETSKKAREVEINKIAESVGKIPEPAAIEDTTLVKVASNTANLLFNKEIPEATLKQIIAQELEKLSLDAAYQEDVNLREANHKRSLADIENEEFSLPSEPTPEQKLLFTDAILAAFENQKEKYSLLLNDLKEANFKTNSAKEEVDFLTNIVNKKLTKYISEAEVFINNSNDKIKELTDTLTSKISSIQEIDVEKYTFAAIENSQQFNFLKSEKGRGFLKNFINSEITKLESNQEFTTAQYSIKENHNKEMESEFINTDLEKLKSDLTSENLLLNGSEELESLEKKLSALKVLESEFFKKKLAEKLKQHEVEFLIKITSDNLTKRLIDSDNGYSSINVAAAGVGLTIGTATANATNNTSHSQKSESLAKTTIKINSPSNNVEDIIAMVNENAKRDEEKSEKAKTFQAKDWFNNKKLLRALEKVAGCNFEELKETLNSNEDIRDNKFPTKLKLTSGDLSVLDAIDELYDTKRAKGKFSVENRNVDRENLKMMMQLIPIDKKEQKEFFKFEKKQNFDLNIIPSNSPTSTKVEQFLQKTNLTYRQ